MVSRRLMLPLPPLLLGGWGAVWLGGCAGDPTADPASAPATGGTPRFATPTRMFLGGFMAPPSALQPTRPGTGMFVKLRAPTALALRGQELLVADSATAQLWRADLILNTLMPVPGAPVGPGTQLELAADYSAVVLDPGARQVLRFGRDGKLQQTFSTRTAAPSPSTLVMVDGSLTPLVGDATLGQWAELRSGGSVALAIRPHRGDGRAAARVDAMAAHRSGLFVLDRLAASVHRVDRQGLIGQSWTHPELAFGGTLAVDRDARIFVADAQGRHLLVLTPGGEPRLLPAVELGVQQIGGMALDDRTLALSDRLVGQVVLYTLQPERR